MRTTGLECLQGFFFLIISLDRKGVSPQEVRPTPTIVDVFENTNVVLTCTTNGSYSAWLKSDVWSYIVLSDGSCKSAGFINNSLLYQWKCHTNGRYSLTLIKVNRSQHGETWRCRQGLSLLSNEVVINIKVPVESVEIILPRLSTVTLVENHYKLFSCKTSYSRPTPHIKWFKQLAEGAIQINTTNSVLIKSDEKRFESATSTLNLTVDRDDNGAGIFCTGDNVIEEKVVSRDITLNVYYSPERGPYIDKVLHNSIYPIKENTKGNITCASAWGNPIPKLSWNCNGTQTTSYEDKREVRLNIQWMARRGEERVCTCESEQEIAGIQTTFIRMAILYPPDSPVISLVSISESHINATIVDKMIVAEHVPFTLLCKANSVPNPDRYSWSKISTANSSSIHITGGLTRNDRKVVICYVSNTMISTEGVSETGHNNRTISVDIHYAPDIDTMNNITSEEGSNVIFSCPVTKGKPEWTSVMWIDNTNGRQWSGANFTLKNVSRTDSTRYTCKVNNTMIMTGGYRKIGTNSKSIDLDVMYKASIIKFFSLSDGANSSVSVEENETVTLICEIEGNPSPRGDIYNNIIFGLGQITNLTNDFVTYHATFKAACLYSYYGIYTCKGSNIVNKSVYSEKNITIFVKCSPRPNPTVPVINQVIATKNAPLSLLFTALAYPKPNVVLWERFNGKSWIAINETMNIRIYRSDLEFGLTIIRASNEDIGKYKLFISNGVGSYFHTFFVDSDSGSEQSVDNTGLIVGLTLSLIVITTTVSILSVIFYKRRKRNQETEPSVNNSIQNGEGEMYQLNENDYEQIQMNIRKMEGHDSDKGKEGPANKHKSNMIYENLAEERQDLNQYSRLNVTNKTNEVPLSREDISIETPQNLEKSAIYVNMKI